MSGILVTQRAERGQPQEPQHSGPQGRRDRLAPPERSVLVPQPFLTIPVNKGTGLIL
jgi:hypothetical protein